jgi:hypothetical protein
MSRKDNLRSSFKIKGYEWKLRYKLDLHVPDIGKCDGFCDIDTRTIWLEKALNVEQRWLVFFHELVHAINHELHVTEEGGIDGVLGEIIAEGLTSVLNEMFSFAWRGSVRAPRGVLREFCRAKRSKRNF